MGYKKKVLVFITVCSMLLFSFTSSISAVDETLDSGRPDLLGWLYRTSTDGASGLWNRISKTGTVTDYPTSFGQSVAGKKYFQCISFLKLRSGMFTKGYSYSMDIEITFSGAGLSGYFFSANDLSAGDFVSLSPDEVASSAGENLGSKVQSSYDADTNTIHLVYRPTTNHLNFCFRHVQWNEGIETKQISYNIYNVTCTWDPDGSYFQQETNKLLEQTNGKLDEVNNNLEEGNQKLDDIKQSIENSSEYEYNYIEGKKEENAEDEEQAQAALDNLLPIEDIKSSLQSFFDALTSNNAVPLLEFPAGHMPAFLGGKKLWDAQSIDFSTWLSNPYISVIITIAKVFFSFWFIRSSVKYVTRALDASVGEGDSDG